MGLAVNPDSVPGAAQIFDWRRAHKQIGGQRFFPESLFGENLSEKFLLPSRRRCRKSFFEIGGVEIIVEPQRIEVAVGGDSKLGARGRELFGQKSVVTLNQLARRELGKKQMELVSERKTAGQGLANHK